MSAVVIAGDTSGAITLQAPAVSGTTTVTIPATTGNFLLDTTTGVCRAWVNFNGTGTVAIRASYNVTSITDHAVGEYGVNFTNALSDANYAVLFTPGGQETTSTANFEMPRRSTTPTTTNVRVIFSNGNQDTLYGSVAVFR